MGWVTVGLGGLIRRSGMLISGTVLQAGARSRQAADGPGGVDVGVKTVEGRAMFGCPLFLVLEDGNQCPLRTLSSHLGPFAGFSPQAGEFGG